jgi:hypothetical protein
LPFLCRSAFDSCDLLYWFYQAADRLPINSANDPADVQSSEACTPAGQTT